MAEWTPHDGGPIQARRGTLVDVLHRDGSVSVRRLVPQLPWEWRHLGTECDIVGWRQATPPAGVATRHPRCGYPYCACVGECFAASQPGVTAGVATDGEVPRG